MEFEYLAKNEEGKKEEGLIKSQSKGQALLILQEKGFYVLSLKEKKVPFYQKEFNIEFGFLEKINDIDLIMFSRQLGILLDSQIGVIDSLRVLIDQIEKKKFKEIVKDIADKVEEGEPFSKALERHSDVFSSFYVGAIESGEASGNLPKSLAYLEEHIERNSKFKKKLVGAMIYPLFILFVFSFVVGFLLFYVIPDLVEMIEELEVDMPIATQIVITASDFVIDWGFLLIILLIAFGVGFSKLIKTEQGKNIFDKTLLKIPGFGNFAKKVYITYFSESMATLMSSGLDIIHALEITENIVGNDKYREIVAETRKDVKEGKDISTSLKKHPDYFPTLVTQMIMVGEKTGKMKKILESIVKFYQDEVERTMESYIKIAEPLLIIMLGAVVGLLVIAVLLPIYNIGLGM